MADYWESMALRGDNPYNYNSDGTVNLNELSSPEEWKYYSLVNNSRATETRRRNQIACDIYYQYHHNLDIRRNGEKVNAYKVSTGYIALITAIQNAMMKEISKR